VLQCNLLRGRNPSFLGQIASSLQDYASQFAQVLWLTNGRVVAGVSGNCAVGVCESCRLLKFTPKQSGGGGERRAAAAAGSSSSVGIINEFVRPSLLIGACARSICKECYRSSVVLSLTEGWWTNLAGESWVRCPAPRCAHFIPMNQRGLFENFLREAGVGDAEVPGHVAM